MFRWLWQLALRVLMWAVVMRWVVYDIARAVDRLEAELAVRRLR